MGLSIRYSCWFNGNADILDLIIEVKELVKTLKLHLFIILNIFKGKEVLTIVN